MFKYVSMTVRQYVRRSEHWSDGLLVVMCRQGSMDCRYWHISTLQGMRTCSLPGRTPTVRMVKKPVVLQIEAIVAECPETI